MTEENKFSKRMHVRGLIRQGSEIIAYHYPMRTFVHHNPLHGLEDLTFEEALREGTRSLGAKGYLPIAQYREYYKNGRIKESDIDNVLSAYVEDKKITIAGREVTHFDVLKSHLISGMLDEVSRSADSLPQRPRLSKLMEHLSSPAQSSDNDNKVGNFIDSYIKKDTSDLGRSLALSQWIDETISVSGEEKLTDLIDRELIKWCESFLDENHAKWVMPYREKGFYGAWKYLAAKECSIHGIRDSKSKLEKLPDNAEDSIIESLTDMGINKENWKDYLTLHLTRMPGWTGFIKWREDQRDNPWQLSNPATLTQYLAIRLYLEKELVQKSSHRELGIHGDVVSINNYISSHKHSYFLRKERLKSSMSHTYSRQVDRLILSSNSDKNSRWVSLADEYGKDIISKNDNIKNWTSAWQLLTLAESLSIGLEDLLRAEAEDLKTITQWMDDFSEAKHGPVWLKAFEAGYKAPLLDKITKAIKAAKTKGGISRPKTQSVFCIDVRSEPFRRHLESVGKNETYGFAGFFSVFIKHRAMESSFEVDHFPVVMKAKNSVREIPRLDQGKKLIEHRKKGKFSKAAYTLYSNLKEHVITPYVMVESIGWFYSVPIIGKTLFTRWYRKTKLWVKAKWMPDIKTQMTINKPTKDEADDMLSFNQHVVIRRALHEKFPKITGDAPDDFVEYLRVGAMAENIEFKPLENQLLTSNEQITCIKELRDNYHINPRWAKSSMSRIMLLGLTETQQVSTVGTSLRMMGLTDNFARLILICGHGSTTDNNPFEAALDCGACGGNSGAPNARVFTDIANKIEVREALREEGINIPDDTFFVAGKHDTTTDDVTFFDVDNLPQSHQTDLENFRIDLKKTGMLNARERCSRFPELREGLTPSRAKRIVLERSDDWSQVRPEWGLSGNAAFIIGRRYLSKEVNLEGRVFLHSYDFKLDPKGTLLEGIMTAPQVVAQWINMEHYFSTVDNEVFGSGSKIYHNVVCKNGIMFGSQSDLRTGLPMQTVMAEGKPFHEPMRLLTIIEAPTGPITDIIERHPLLQNYYNNSWVHLVSIDPEEGSFSEYIPNKGWEPCK